MASAIEESEGVWVHHDIGGALMNGKGNRLLRLALAFMRSQGANVRDPTEHDLEELLMLVEFGCVCGTDPGAEINSFFGVHKDDFGGVNGPVCTVVFYIEITMEGGALALYSSENAAEPYARIDPRALLQEGAVRAVVMGGRLAQTRERLWERQAGGPRPPAAQGRLGPQTG
jgi:hypothetical protein